MLGKQLMNGIRGRGLLTALVLVGAMECSYGLCQEAPTEPTPEQALYWWQDELREVAAAVSAARSGAVSPWPKMSVPAGSATMPLAPAAGEIRADGKLDEKAWQEATTFPVGSIFDEWSRGLLLLQVSACRDAEHLYLAIRAPRDLTGLGTHTPDGELFRVDNTPYRVGPGGLFVVPPSGELVVPPSGGTSRLKPELQTGGSIAGDGCVIELVMPYHKGGPVSLSFTVENLRYVDGRLPPAARSLGIDKLQSPAGGRSDYRTGALWLEPISVRLVPARHAARLESPPADGGHDGVSLFSWQQEIDGKTFSYDGFTYREPIAGTLKAAEAILDRAVAAGSRSADPAGDLPALDAIQAALQNASPEDCDQWRALYCRARGLRARMHLALLDAPLLFVKQHPYFAGHIYDDYYTWHPGGGIYVLESPHDAAHHAVRPLIDPTTNETLGVGVYRDPEVSWQADRVLFAFKGEDGNTSLYEIGIDGHGLRRLTDPGGDCRSIPTEATPFEGQHDVTPCYLPDGRIAFTSTRPRALVPCFNSRVDTLHTVDADGGNVRSVSSNNVNEFDPAVLPDGRILYGRWEYVDKTALYLQSLWTVLPDGRMEEALFGNNLAKPTAILDARPVPGTNLLVASLTPHNGQAVGAIGMIDPLKGKNDLAAIFNFTPEYPLEMDQGLRVGPCDPWPLSSDDVLVSNNAIAAHAIIELIDRQGDRELVYCDPEISCYAPMLVKPRQKPTIVRSQAQPVGSGTDVEQAKHDPPATEPDRGRFLVVDVYQGMGDVPRGSIKRLRIVEETARASGLPPGGRWWNQAFLVSWQGAYIVKNFLGTVPVHEDGSAYFEVPAGRAVYFELLDDEGREIQRMRTFVQAVPGATRSCVGCHEAKKTAPLRPGRPPLAMLGEPARPEPESWGSGYIDYPSMIQPLLDKHCVRCHGGEKGMKAGLDFSGGWTWAFNISYETLIKHRLTGFLNCHNSSVHTAEILPPRTIGSGAAPLAEILIKRRVQIPRHERDLLLAWMDTNSNYYGTWDYTPYATCEAILGTAGPLVAVMKEAGCNACHQPGYVGNDWVNLRTPEWSRILRAPMAESESGLGLAMCRQRKARTGYPPVTQRVQPPDVFLDTLQPEWGPSGEPHVSLATTDDPHYRQMLTIICRARAEALATPRVDMPGAEIIAGECRMQTPPVPPDTPPAPAAALRPDGSVELSWRLSAATIGLQFELHRGSSPQFAPEASTQIGLTTAGRFVDLDAPSGLQHYALVATSAGRRSQPARTSIDVPPAAPPAAPLGLTIEPAAGEIALAWLGPQPAGVRYHVYRAEDGSTDFVQLSAEPLAATSYSDVAVRPEVSYAYAVRAVDRRGRQSDLSQSAEAAPLPEIQEPVFKVDFAGGAMATLLDGEVVKGRLHAGAKVADGSLVLASTGFAAFDDRPELDVRAAMSVECWVRIDRESQMPVVLSAGAFNSAGWFLQRYGRGWRWHLAPVSCDGGRSVVGRWTHLAGTYNGRKACLYQDGELVAEVDAAAGFARFDGPLVIGQYSRQADSYQVHGAISGVKIYHRVLRPDEIADREAEKGTGPICAKHPSGRSGKLDLSPFPHAPFPHAGR